MIPAEGASAKGSGSGGLQTVDFFVRATATRLAVAANELSVAKDELLHVTSDNGIGWYHAYRVGADQGLCCGLVSLFVVVSSAVLTLADLIRKRLVAARYL